MKSPLEKLLAAARAHRREDEPPDVPPGLGRRLARQARAVCEPDGAWLRGLAYGFALCALAAMSTAMLPQPQREALPAELMILAGLGDESDASQP